MCYCRENGNAKVFQTAFLTTLSQFFGPKQKGRDLCPKGTMCMSPHIFEWGPYLKLVATSCTITVPSLILLPQSAQFSYFYFFIQYILTVYFNRKYFFYIIYARATRMPARDFAFWAKSLQGQQEGS